MTAIQILGLAAGTITSITFLPQVLQIWKTKSAKDLSLQMLLLLILVPNFYKIKEYFIIGFVLVVAKALQPTWYFLGIQDMKINSIVLIIISILSLLLIQKTL